MLPFPDPGHGHSTRSATSRWLLETLTDSDWSGAKGHRRSTSAAIHMLNGHVVLASSRGQKSVSLSLEFSRSRAECAGQWSSRWRHPGPGKLRHISGKLLRIQDLAARGDVEVKAVGTVANVADLGTKPLAKARVNLILQWCQIYNADGERIGQG